MNTEFPPDVALPCGCVLRHAIVDGIHVLTLVACRQSCEEYLNLLRSSTTPHQPESTPS